MKLHEALEQEKEIISDPACWTKGTGARDAHGLPITPWGKNAVCFCAYGAIAKATYDEPDELELRTSALMLLGEAVHRSAWVFNDDESTQHSDVLAMFDRAIVLAKEA